MARDWYLVYSKPRQERLAQLHLQNQDFIVFLPTYGNAKLKAGHITTAIKPLFPRYLFIQAKNSDASLCSVRYTKGVADFVRFGSQLAVVPQNLIDQIAKVQRCEVTKPLFCSGDKVQIAEGPFSGFSAVFQMPKAQDRCLVLLEWLGQNLVANVALSQLAEIH
ncbi:transcription/translation regulatory transformer protein RfaH [Rheinheimera sp. 1928-s]|uniref:transcription/translation regulatory transformer protein RfaH n=1 Tax=Rheinheimera sp. 1928-s TaxID=3033803 RepID=UPI00261CF499|nr:transcription/translation regulatory transformer protein RfaH [Rheinheimera sp. 1928-s]MDF3125770.1 transcription/translation regulatory transformer protein RfaH [Rheinheimera sp. 1928-s]